MRKMVSIFLAFVVLTMSTAGVSAQEPASSALRIKRSTPVVVELTSIVSSNKQETVSATVAYDVMDATAEQVLIKRGTPVVVNVERIKTKGMGKGGSVRVQPISTMAIDGTAVMLVGNAFKEGRNTSTALVLGLVLGLVVLPFVGFAFFALPGEKAEIPAGTIIQNIVTADTYSISVP